ncbi:EIN3-binding F-box protein 1-like protein [Tanacetum coccineum]
MGRGGFESYDYASSQVRLEDEGRVLFSQVNLLDTSNYYVSDKGVVAFSKSTLTFETLILEECHTVTQLSVSRCNSLKSLSVLNYSEFGNYSLALLGQLCHQFHNVVLNGLHRITNNGFTSLIHNSKASLMKVDLSGCLSITDKVVYEIPLAHGVTPEVLNLDACRSITDASMINH